MSGPTGKINGKVRSRITQERDQQEIENGVHMGFIGLIGNSERGYNYCLVLIDVLTRYLIAEQIKTKTAIGVTKVFFKSVLYK